MFPTSVVLNPSPPCSPHVVISPQSLNAVSQTRWAVNDFVLDHVNQVYLDGSELGEIPGGLPQVPNLENLREQLEQDPKWPQRREDIKQWYHDMSAQWEAEAPDDEELLEREAKRMAKRLK